MLVSGGQGIMHPEVTYGVSRIACVVRSSHVRLCSLLRALNHASVLPFHPPSPSLTGGFGKYWVCKYFH